MAHKEVHIGDDWYLGENDDGDLVLHSVRKDKDIRAVDSQETSSPVLGGAGFSKGDFLSLYTFNPSASRTASTTSTSYVSDDNLSLAQIVWNDFFPADVTVQIGGYIYIAPGTDESVDVRIRNETDDEVIFEETDITSNKQLSVTPITYSPSTKNSITTYRWKFRTNPGANSTTLRDPYIIFGVKI